MFTDDTNVLRSNLSDKCLSQCEEKLKAEGFEADILQALARSCIANQNRKQYNNDSSAEK